ncbi:MAG TPA: MFS transporter [Micromonosporaceae bacterium]|nr:MFS transporter [Micromonosporaceae bacterium]
MAEAAARGLARDRNFALLWTGQTVSELGSAVTALVLPLVAVATLGASAIAVSLVAAASSVAWLVVALPAGAWVDRVRRRPVLIAADLGRAAALTTVPVAWTLGPRRRGGGAPPRPGPPPARSG